MSDPLVIPFRKSWRDVTDIPAVSGPAWTCGHGDKLIPVRTAKRTLPSYPAYSRLSLLVTVKSLDYTLTLGRNSGSLR